MDPYPIVDKGKCVGCGICEQVCSTVNDRIAIKVLSGRLVAGAPGADSK
jgi:ferredoxin-type protein NapG